MSASANFLFPLFLFLQIAIGHRGATHGGGVPPAKFEYEEPLHDLHDQNHNKLLVHWGNKEAAEQWHLANGEESMANLYTKMGLKKAAASGDEWISHEVAHCADCGKFWQLETRKTRMGPDGRPKGASVARKHIVPVHGTQGMVTDKAKYDGNGYKITEARKASTVDGNGEKVFAKRKIKVDAYSGVIWKKFVKNDGQNGKVTRTRNYDVQGRLVKEKTKEESQNAANPRMKIMRQINEFDHDKGESSAKHGQEKEIALHQMLTMVHPPWPLQWDEETGSSGVKKEEEGKEKGEEGEKQSMEEEENGTATRDAVESDDDEKMPQTEEKEMMMTTQGKKGKGKVTEKAKYDGKGYQFDGVIWKKFVKNDGQNGKVTRTRNYDGQGRLVKEKTKEGRQSAAIARMKKEKGKEEEKDGGNDGGA